MRYTQNKKAKNPGYKCDICAREKFILSYHTSKASAKTWGVRVCHDDLYDKQDICCHP